MQRAELHTTAGENNNSTTELLKHQYRVLTVTQSVHTEVSHCLNDLDCSISVGIDTVVRMHSMTLVKDPPILK